MNKISLIQGSEEWKSLRLNKITSTDSATIFGTNPYSNEIELYDIKMGLKPPPEVNSRMARGSALESEALNLLGQKVGIKFSPAVVLHENGYCMTSLDGLSECEQFVAEIKAPGIKNHELCSKGEIPAYWYTQCMWHLYVTRLDLCYFCSYFPGHVEESVIIEIKRDQEYIDQLFLKCKDFYYNHLCAWQRPWTFKSKKCDCG